MNNWLLALTSNPSRKAVLVTLLEHSGSSPREPGAKMLVFENGEFVDSIGGGNLEKTALEECKKIFLNQNALKVSKQRIPLGALTGQCCGGTVELLYEVMNDSPQVYIFGAGHVGQALANILVGTPFGVHLIDDRKEWIAHSNIHVQVQRHEMSAQEFLHDMPESVTKTFVVVMTHDHSVDQEIIEKVVFKNTAYIGLIGSDSKWARFKQRFEQKGLNLQHFEKVHCPIGVDIGGGKSPQEVAISVAGQLLKASRNR